MAVGKTFVVVYSGDANFNPSMSKPIFITSTFLKGPRGTFQQFVRKA
jgi:hypothetical protein